LLLCAAVPNRQNLTSNLPLTYIENPNQRRPALNLRNGRETPISSIFRNFPEKIFLLSADWKV
jgi:hypothetical protein